MSEAPLPNDDAARSTTGEILDSRDVKPLDPTAKQAETPTPDPTKAPTNNDQSTPKSKDSAASIEPPKPDAKSADAKPADKSATVEAYTDFAAPEGYTLDKALIEKATPLLREVGLNQEQAQKLITLQAEQMIAAAKAPQDTYENLRKDWQTKVNSDNEMKSYANHDKSGLEAVKIDIAKGLEKLGDPTLVKDFKEAMDLTGAGDHPAFVKAIWKFSQLVGEGKAVTGKGPSPLGQVDSSKGTSAPSAAQALYPGLPSVAR